jgi:hypothetical protein
MERRKLLAATAAAFVRQRVYRVPEGLEIDETEHFEVVRRRVFFDEVFLVTLHVRTGIVSLVLTGTFGLLLGGLAAWFWWSQKEGAGALVFAIPSAILLAFGTLRAVLGVGVVTVQGRRGRATLLFPFRRGKARRIYEEICRDVAATQRTNQVSLEWAASEPLGFTEPLRTRDPAP